MLEVKDMTFTEIEGLLDRMRYGHLACAHHDHPYIVPIHFAYNDRTIYVFTTEGKKSEMIEKNPEVCLQIEDVKNEESWASVIIVGDAEKLTAPKEREQAFAAITAVNPSLTPALNFRWVDKWVREQRDDGVIYRINRKTITGRRTADH